MSALAEKTNAVCPSRRYLLEIAGAFVYPVSSISGVFFLLFMAPLWAVSSLVGGILWILVQLVIGGYVAAYMWEILFDTAMDKKGGPTMPLATDIGELAGNCCRFFLASAIAFLPLIGLALFAAFADRGLFGYGGFQAALWAAALFGIFYYPMTLLIIGFADTLFAPLNYVFGFRSIARIFGPYVACALFFVLTFAGAAVMWALLVSSVPGDGLGIIASSITAMVALFLYAVQMRALGLLYACTRQRLGWFRP